MITNSSNEKSYANVPKSCPDIVAGFATTEHEYHTNSCEIEPVENQFDYHEQSKSHVRFTMLLKFAMVLLLCAGCSAHDIFENDVDLLLLDAQTHIEDEAFSVMPPNNSPTVATTSSPSMMFSMSIDISVGSFPFGSGFSDYQSEIAFSVPDSVAHSLHQHSTGPPPPPLSTQHSHLSHPDAVSMQLSNDMFSFNSFSMGLSGPFSDLVFSTSDSMAHSEPPPPLSGGPGYSVVPPIGESLSHGHAHGHSHSMSHVAPPPPLSAGPSFNTGYSVVPPIGESLSHGGSQGHHSHSHAVASVELSYDPLSFNSFSMDGPSFSTPFSQLEFSTSTSHGVPPPPPFSAGLSFDPGYSVVPPVGESLSHAHSQSTTHGHSEPPPPFSAGPSFNAGYSVVPPIGESLSHGHSHEHSHSTSHVVPPPPFSGGPSFNPGYSVVPPIGESFSHGCSQGHHSHSHAVASVELSYEPLSFNSFSMEGPSFSAQFSQLEFSTSTSHGHSEPPPPFSAGLSFDPGYSVVPPIGESLSHGQSHGHSHSMSHVAPPPPFSAGPSFNPGYSVLPPIGESLSHGHSHEHSHSTSHVVPPPPFSAGPSFDPGYSVAPPVGESHSHGLSHGHSHGHSHEYSQPHFSAGLSGYSFVPPTGESHSHALHSHSVSHVTPPPPLSAGSDFSSGLSAMPPTHSHVVSLPPVSVAEPTLHPTPILSFQPPTMFSMAPPVYIPPLSFMQSFQSVMESPSVEPTTGPNVEPTMQPTAHGTEHTLMPTAQASVVETVVPSAVPSAIPSAVPSAMPSEKPSFAPSELPTVSPSAATTAKPSIVPTAQPTRIPTASPSAVPTKNPTASPSEYPTFVPTEDPSINPTEAPTAAPTMSPSWKPTREPTLVPTTRPTLTPSLKPTTMPTPQPSMLPTAIPTENPTGPSVSPTYAPTNPTTTPTVAPSAEPTAAPTADPTIEPTEAPTDEPTVFPTETPTADPTADPSQRPTKMPSAVPTTKPTLVPSAIPSCMPTETPTADPTVDPTADPSAVPSAVPSASPSFVPTANPTVSPTVVPTAAPTRVPSAMPTVNPSVDPSAVPTFSPTTVPTVNPTIVPSAVPSCSPTVVPTADPSVVPSAVPSAVPTVVPTHEPSTAAPSLMPTSVAPTTKPTASPSSQKPTQAGQTQKPTTRPSAAPTYDSNYAPTNAYKEFVVRSTAYKAIANSYTFATYYYKGQTLDGGSCADWTSFTSNNLQLPFDDLEFTSLTMYASNFDFRTSVKLNTTATCSSATELAGIISGLQRKAAYSATCGGRTWNVFQCPSVNGQNVLCVDCEAVCDSACPGSGFLVNTCNSCETREKAAGAVVNAAYAQKILYPVFSAVPTVVTTRTTATATVTVNTAGTIYCSALRPTANLATVMQIKNTGNKVIADAAGSFSVVITGLNPDTSYSVYCYSEDFSAHVMPVSVALASKVSIKTDCCRGASFSKTHSSIVQYVSTSSRPEQQFSFVLDSTPNSALTATVSLAKVDCSSRDTVLSATVTDISILPATFSFSDSSTSLSGTFVLRASGFTGCYAATVATTGSDSYTSATTTFELQSATSPPSLPALSKVLFSDSGTALLFNFDSATDRGAAKITAYASAFSCSLIVSFPGSSNAVCRWITSSQLSATLATTGTQAEIDTDTASVLGDIVRAACVANTICANYGYMSTAALTIAKPDNALQPTVSLSTSTSISPCSDIKLDPTLSKGFAGRDWESVEWSVTGSAIAQNTADIATLLNTNFQDTFSVAKIPNSYLTRSTGVADSTYSITLKLTNFLQQSAIATVTVKVNAEGSSIIPSIILSGTKDVVYRWQPLSVSAAVSWPSCASNATKALPVSYAWKLYQGTALTSLTSTSLDKRFFKQPAYSLEASTTYLISVTASVTTAAGDVISSYVSSTLQTGQSGVRAVISGAAERTGSTLESVSIDGSSSQDIDYPTGLLSVLTYTWSCKVYAPVFGGTCVGFVPSTTSRQTIAAGAIDAQTYTISLAVTNAAGKTESASIQLTMLENRVPGIVVSDPKTKYNPDDKITLGATITPSAGNAFGAWSSSSVASLDDIAVTPITRNFGHGSSYLYQLAIAGGSLTAGLSYTFQISAYYTSNSANVATGSVTIVMNAPPAGGSLAVTPSVGTALTQVFLLQTSRWTDDAADLPLNYVLSSYTVKPTKQNSIKASDAVSYAETKLGQGLADNNYLVYCVATASDIYGSSASTTTSVTVNPPASTDAVVDATSSSIDNALSNGDPSGVQQAVDGALGSINSVDCTVPTECGSIHREKCSETARTCGPCLTGYVGPAGDSNKECKAKKSRRLDEAVDMSVKTCPSDCSQQGECVFYDLYGNGISNCTVTETLCRAKCVCDTGYYGRSCSLGLTEYTQYLSLREKLCVSIYKTTKLQDVTSDVVSSRALSISNILLDINQISDAALGNCTAALVDTVTKYPDLSCQGTSFDLISTALSNILEKGNEIPEDLLSDVGAALVALTEGCQTSLSVGEDPVTFSTANVNLLAAVSDKASLDGTIIDAPQSDYDTENGVIPATVEVDTSNLGDADTVAITVFQYTNNPNGQVTNSSKVNVLTTGNGAASTPGVTLVLINVEPITYTSSIADGPVTVECMQYESAPYTVTATCSNGMDVEVSCPAFSKGNYEVTCPGVSEQPQCETFNGAEFVVNPLCNVTAFDAYTTTCFCEGSVTRRYLASGESVATEFSSSFVAIATDFGTTFTTAPTLSDVQNNPIILSTLAGVVGTFIIGMYFFLRWDRIDAERYHANLLKESKKKKKIRMVFQFFDSIFPDELRAGTWFHIFVEQLRSDHFLVRLFVTNEKDKSSRAVFWSTAMGKLVAFLFMNSLVASVMYPDDGYCEGFDSRSACTSAKTTGGMFDACRWIDENASCEFNPPQIDFLTSIIITLIVTMLTVPLDKLIEANVRLIAQYFHYRELERKIAIDDKPAEGVLMRKFDEFSLAQTQRSTILRAARLDKARAHMDFVPPEEEASIVTAYALKVSTDAAAAAAASGSVLTSVLAQLNFKRYRYSIDHVTTKALVKRVADVRSEADTMYREMEVMDSTEEQEKFLMRQFIVNAFPLIQRGVVAKYFLKEYSLKRTDYVKFKEIAAFVFLPCLLGFLIYYVYVFNLSIGSRATNMWLVVTFIGLAQDIFLLQPIKVFINFIVINGNVSKEVRQLCERLSLRSKLIMMRTHGMMRDADALIQHFNPACRVARMYPSLPISRLLMSLNDHDLPQRQLPHPTLIPWAYFSTGVVALMLLPDVLQETALDISSGAISDFGLIAFYFFAQHQLGLMIALIVLFVVAVVAYTYWRHNQKHNERFHVEAKYAVTSKDAEDAEKDDSAPGSPAKPPRQQAKGANADAEALEAGIPDVVPVSDLFTLEEYNADDIDDQQDFGSVWGLNKNKTKSRGNVNSAPNLVALRSSEVGAAGASGTGMDATYAPSVRSFKPEQDLPHSAFTMVSPKVAIAAVPSDEESVEQPSNPIQTQEAHKPAPRAGSFPAHAAHAVHAGEEADANQASQEAEVDYIPAQSRGASDRSHQPSEAASAAAMLDGPRTVDIIGLPSSGSKIRLEPLDRGDDSSSAGSSPSKKRRQKSKQDPAEGAYYEGNDSPA